MQVQKCRWGCRCRCRFRFRYRCRFRCKGLVQGARACEWCKVKRHVHGCTLRAPVLGLREESVSQVTPRSSRTGLYQAALYHKLLPCRDRVRLTES